MPASRSARSWSTEVSIIANASNPDLVVIGAGAAGLAAAATAREQGLDTVLIEAAGRVGGRAWTDTETFGVPFDRGCHWLHSASRNPFTEEAERLGHRFTRKSSAPAATFIGEGWADEAGREAIWGRLQDVFEAMHAAGQRGHDVSARTFLDPQDPLYQFLEHWIALFTASDAADVSALDYDRYADTWENWPVDEGYGALVARVFGDQQARLNTPATAIDWSGEGVRVETPDGAIRARAAIVTVSTGVLAGGAIRFTPGLPDAYGEAFEALPVGCAEKVVLAFDRDVFDVPATSYVNVLDLGDPARRPINFLLRPGGSNLAVGTFAGSFARNLLAEGEAAVADFGLAALCDAYGSGIRRHLVKAAATAWVADPLIAGAYSIARPGKADCRRVLADPVGGRIFFAGEAVSQDAFSTCHGARATGEAAARAVVAEFGARGAA